MELKEYIGKKIQYFRKQANMTQQDLADKLNTTKQTISRYEKGQRRADQDILFVLCDIFNVSINDFFPETQESPSKEDKLLTQITDNVIKLEPPRRENVLRYTEAQLDEQDKGGEIREDNVTYLSDYIEAKREGFVAAGTGQYLLDDHKEMVTIPSSILPKKSYDLMLQVKGDSMLPTFKDDEFVFVKKSTDIHNGQFGVFRINNESYIKKVYIENERLKLVSLNPSYPDLFFDETDDIELVGVVVM